MSLKIGKKKSKTPNYFSHEFVISNHGDICSIVAMVFVVGLLFKVSFIQSCSKFTQGTTPLASKFILMQHNSTLHPTVDGRSLYFNGFYDIFACFFYTLALIVVHAIIQEYVLDKLSKRMSMTKARLSRFNYAAQTTIFLAFSIYYLLHIMYTDGLIKSISDLWDSYPHTPLSLWAKFFFILQISYWAHNIPELYFQKVKKEDIVSRITPSIFFLIGIGAAYALNLNKLCALILLVQYSSDFVFFLSRASDLALKVSISRPGFAIWNTIFIPARIVIICLTFLTLQYGLARNSKDTINFQEGNFNTRLIRINCLAFVFISQAWMMWVFVNYHLKKRRENAPLKPKASTNEKKKDKKKSN